MWVVIEVGPWICQARNQTKKVSGSVKQNILEYFVDHIEESSRSGRGRKIEKDIRFLLRLGSRIS